MRHVGISMIMTVLLAGGSFSAQAAQEADTATTATNLKIGFVNSMEVLYGTAEGKQEIDKVEQFILENQQVFDQRSAELQQLQQQFANQERTLNPTTRVEMQRSIEEKDRQLKRFQEDTQLEINRRRDELLSRLSEKVETIINDYAQQQGFGVIFLRDQQSQLFVAPALDITAEIIRIYNERHPVPAAAPPSGAAPPQP